MVTSPTEQPHPFCRVAWHYHLCLQLRFPTATLGCFQETTNQQRIWTIFSFLQCCTTQSVSRFVTFHELDDTYYRKKHFRTCRKSIVVYVFTHVLFLLSFCQLKSSLALWIFNCILLKHCITPYLLRKISQDLKISPTNRNLYIAFFFFKSGILRGGRRQHDCSENYYCFTER